MVSWWWGRQEWMEACDFHRRSPPAWGRNCKFPFISSCVALGTSVKWENFKFGFHPHYCFPIISLHLKGIAGQLYPGPSLGVLTQESDTFEPQDLRLEQAWARRPSGQAWNGSSAPHRSCWRSRDQWFSLSSICNHRQAWSRRRSFRLGYRGTWPSILRAECTPWASFSPSAIRSTDERVPCLHFWRKCGFVCPGKPVFRILLEYLVLGSYCVQ